MKRAKIILLTLLGAILLSKPLQVKAETCCYKDHKINCYEKDVSNHVHKDKNGNGVTALTSRENGGCFTEYHAGTSYETKCYGNLQRSGSFMDDFEADTCECQGSVEGAYVPDFHLASTDEHSDGFTDHYEGTCSNCGATCRYDYTYIYWYRCNSCGLGTSFYDEYYEHYMTVNNPSFYTAACGKDISELYHEYGDGDVALPVCDRTVIGITLDNPSQNINPKAGETINRNATALFLDGHEERIVCVLSDYDEEKCNVWQDVTFSYGEYALSEEERPEKKQFSVKGKVYAKGTAFINVSSDNRKMGMAYIKGKESPAEVVIGTEVKLIGNAYTGYEVSEWILSDGRVVKDLPEIALSMPEYDISAKCVYKPKIYTAYFDASGGTFSDGKTVHTVSAAYGKTYGIVAQPVREGYMFNGWKLNDGASSAKDVGNPEYETVSEARDHTFYADWIKKGPTFFYTSYDADFSDLFVPFMKGYDFEGWYLQERSCNDGTGLRLSDEIPVKTLYTYDGKEIKKETDGFVIYAGWKPKVINVTFKCTENVFIDSSVQIKGAYGKPIQYKTNGNGNKYNGIEANKKVIYDMEYSEMPEPVMVDENNSIRNDVVFAGWSITGEDKDIILPGMTVSVTEDLILYPVFKTAAEVKVTLDMNGGTAHSAFLNGTKKNPFTVKTGKVYGDTLGFLPTYSGHEFKGWNFYKDGSGNAVINTTTRVSSDKDHTLYAKWEHYVYYNANDRDIYGEPITEPVYGAVERNRFVNSDKTPQKIKENGFYRKYHTFVGWNTDPEGKGDWYISPGEADKCKGTVYKTEIGAELNGSVTLYAQWDNIITIRLDERGGKFTGGERVIVTNYGKTIPERADIPKKDMYMFMGYYTGIRGTGEKVYDENGKYCYDHNGKEVTGGRVKLVYANTVRTGTTYGSVISSDSVVSWNELDVLYACWKLIPYEDGYDITKDIEIYNDLYDISEAIPSTEDIFVKGKIPGVFVAYDYGDHTGFFAVYDDTLIRYEDEDTEELKYADTYGNSATYDPLKKVIPIGELSKYSRYEARKLCLIGKDKDGTDLFPSEDHGLITLGDNGSYKTLSGKVPMNVTARNGEYEVGIKLFLSDGSVTEVTGIKKKVVIHDPVLITGTADDKITLSGDKNRFTILLSNTGTHLNKKGYGYKDHSVSESGQNLIKRTVVVFPFDVTITAAEGETFVKAGQVYETKTNSISCYVSGDTTIGQHYILCAAESVNCSGEATYDENAASVNLDPSFHYAVCKIGLFIESDIKAVYAEKINNDEIKRFDDDGLPLMFYGNKLDVLILFSGKGNEDYTVKAIPSCKIEKDGKIYDGKVYSTVSAEGGITAFLELFNEYCKEIEAVYKEEGYAFTFVMPYLSYPVLDENVPKLLSEAAVNTLSGNEDFFEKDSDIIVTFDIEAENERGERVRFAKNVKVRVKRE